MLIFAILCDEKSLYFYKFDKKHDLMPWFLRGKFGHHQFEIPVPADVDNESHTSQYVGQNHYVSEVLYYVFLVEYVTGLEMCCSGSMTARKAIGSWHKAFDMARKSLNKATQASML